METTFGEPTWLDRGLYPLAAVRVAVFGDFCLDAYWLLEEDAVELSIETGLPVRRVGQQRFSLGGAGNVAANLIDLGVTRVQAIGVAGNDLFGRELLRLLEERGADIGSGMVTDANWQTMVYAKPHSGEQEESRIDFGAFNVLSDETAEVLAVALDRAAADNNVIILNQQVPQGLSTPAMIDRINAVIARHTKTIFVADSRHRPELYRGAVLKLNAHEAAKLLGRTGQEDDSVETAVDMIRQISLRTENAVFLTRGEKGILVAEGESVHQVAGIQLLSRTDPVGAGDTVVSAIAAVLGSGQDSLTAAQIANIAAAVTVQKLQTTGTATPAEILAVGSEPDYVFEPDLAEMPHRARFLDGADIERIGEVPDDLDIQHCIFDHDGTISTLREGWEKIMEPMMVRTILGTHYENASPAVFAKITSEVRGFIDRTTGIQTLAQMKGLVELVRQGGFVEDRSVLDEHGYKHIFNQDLLAMVGRRMEKLRLGELSSEDFQIKNAVDLLRALRERGVKLYLASGTDEADVVAEATALGYADLFEGMIFGAVGDIKVEAKRVVLERIIQKHNLSGHHFAVFGDGPVEMREARKRGGLSIGVASDEVRRFGWNYSKRSRLIRAGATLIVPDFSQLNLLLQALRLTPRGTKHEQIAIGR
jgi:rfaE bifunctional protein kinase chain/domain